MSSLYHLEDLASECKSWSDYELTHAINFYGRAPLANKQAWDCVKILEDESLARKCNIPAKFIALYHN